MSARETRDSQFIPIVAAVNAHQHVINARLDQQLVLLLRVAVVSM